MIKLTKCAKPKILADNATNWTTDLMSFVSSNTTIPDRIKNKYNEPEIKNALIQETHGKCMYCESYISAIAPEHIEHYRPKSIYPDKTFDWENLGLACPWCNTKKNNSFDENCPVVNPYIDNPDEFFISAGTLVCHRPNNCRAELTELLLELNRPELIESRKGRLDAIRPLIDKYCSATNLTIKQLLKENIKTEMADDKPYAMCVRAMVHLLSDIR